MNSKYYFLIISSFICLMGFSQLKTITDKTTYPFWINVPEKENTEKQPILIFLHGKSLSGTDLNRVRRYGVLRAMDKGRKIPAIVVAPQLAKGSWNPDKVLERPPAFLRLPSLNQLNFSNKAAKNSPLI